MPRNARMVIEQLLLEKVSTITCFPPNIKDTDNDIRKMIQGTAVFPGGSGLWRGSGFFGPLPELFPDAPFMIVGHNFDSRTGYMKSKDRGGELQSPHTFWGVLLGYLRNASMSPQVCFFTNAMMGLMPEGATGKMPIEKMFKEQYENQCRQLLIKQIDIVKPRALISLGGEAGKFVAKIRPTIPWHRSMHPSAREFKPLDRREIRISSEGQAIDRFITTNNLSRH